MEIDWTLAGIAAAWAIILGGAGGALTEIGEWYRDLNKPSWQPPDWLFGPAWTIILGLSGWSFYLALSAAQSTSDTVVIAALFAANFVLHFAWSPLFFKIKRPDWALAENVFLWLSVLSLCLILPLYSPLAGWLNVPYICWVSFAFLLNWKIVQLNRPFGTA
ncbi:tryptophan-rich sensory protein [Erythrobacter sp. SCSIO 43205]|uniref:TspO/MBR family protein n=1 Tax=Erythrobacter sp. SCSIO 43205 TaxID=2779361 RepID=UPI001CA86765|nr:TspO/MBR family protein [Erythrobacter sp. SCSIO 43205]UAB77129.1 tryptophan-rich sensory protein [Erythrobacter sp. SCSIO 43205]